MIRRATKKSERRTPCVVCGFPRSHRHHRFPVSVYGEHEHTMQLCSNCHGIYHLLERHYIQKLLSARNEIASPTFKSWLRKNGRTADTLVRLVHEDNRHRAIYDSELLKLGEEADPEQLLARVGGGEFDEEVGGRGSWDWRCWAEMYKDEDRGETPEHVRDRLIGMEVVEIHGRAAEDENDQTQVSYFVLQCPGCGSKVMVHRVIGFSPLGWGCGCTPIGNWRSREEGHKIRLDSVW